MPANRITTPVTTVPIRTRDSRIDSRKSRLKYKPARNSAPIPTRNARICKLELSASSAPGAFAVAPTRFRFGGRSCCVSSLIHGDTGLSQKWLRSYPGSEEITLVLLASVVIVSPTTSTGHVTALSTMDISGPFPPPEHTFPGIKMNHRINFF